MSFQVCMTCAYIKEEDLENVGDQTVSVPIDFYCMDKSTWKSMGSLCLVTNIKKEKKIDWHGGE